jgi:alpha-L-fucosidase
MTPSITAITSLSLLMLLSLPMSGPLALGQSPVLPKAATPPGHEERVKRAKELSELKWGMFICWSFSTWSGHEWTGGQKDISMFKATEVDTDQWARTAKECGMGYILFLTRHIDGFCLWDTQTTDRKVTKSQLGLDVLAELRKSCDKHGIKLALYFAEGDLKDNKDYYPGGYTAEMKKAQLKELLTQYGRIEYLWLDNWNPPPGMDHDQTTAYCHELQPGTLVGYNQPPKSGELEIRERGGARPTAPGYLVAEFTYPILPDHEGGAKWFYSLPKHDNLCHPAKKLYRDYVQAVKHGNIFSIDIGPDYKGKLRAIDVKTLREVAEMIKNPPQPPNPPPVSQGKPVKASGEWSTMYDAAKAVDGDEYSRWSARKDATNGWIEVDLEKERSIDRAVAMEMEYPLTCEWALEYKEGDEWKALASGKKLEFVQEIKFPPVKARYVRLNILKSVKPPTFFEFQVFAHQP